MKRKIALTIILLLLGSLVTGIFAQTKIKYQGEVDLGYSIGIGKKLDYSSFEAQTIHGIKVGKYFSTGVGIGFKRYFDIAERFIPLTLNLKGFLPFTEDLSGFIYADGGWGFGADSEISGLHIASGVGLAYKYFKFQVGYNNQFIEWTGFSHNSISIRLGFIF